MKHLYIYIAIITMATLSACCTHRNNEACKPLCKTDANSFAVKLFDTVCKTEEKENFCISPASVSWALSMVANGASGNTLQQILGTLGLKDGDIKGFNENQKAFMQNLQTDAEGTSLSIANSVWINETLSVKEPFITTNKNYYNAQVESVPFNDNTLNRINNWCSENTNGKITSILNSLDNKTKMLLLNALYMKSQWKESFNPNITADASFTKENGKTMNVRMMKQKFKTSYLENSYFQMVSKPLENGKFEMLFILPHKDKSISEITEKLAVGYKEYYEQMAITDVNLSLPKFKSEYGTSLKNMLINLGMSDAFGSRAKFKNISNAPLYIDDIYQKSYIAVDEYGVEAVAITAIMVGLLSAQRPATPKEVVLNRPFIYIIAERMSNDRNILFMGKVGAPQVEQ